MDDSMDLSTVVYREDRRVKREGLLYVKKWVPRDDDYNQNDYEAGDATRRDLESELGVKRILEGSGEDELSKYFAKEER